MDLFVDVDALSELSRQLTDVKAALERTQDRVEGYAGRLGSGRLADALGDFVDGWRDGRKHIVEEIDALLGRVRAAVDAYREQESALARAARGEA